MPALWAADTYVWLLIDTHAYGPGTAAMRPVAVLSVVAYLLVLAAALPGLVVLRLDRPRVLLLLFVLYTCALHVATFGDVRFRLPLMPFLFLTASDAWCGWRARRFPRLGGARRALLAALLIAAVAAMAAGS